MNAPRYPQGHALIIAIAAYRHIKPLPSVVLNDAREISSILSSPQYCGYNPENITQLLDGFATRDAILAELDDLAARTGPDDTVCIYFSGHGYLVDGDESSLLPVDCTAGNISGTSLSAFEFSEALHRIEAKRLMVFLDACHAAGAGSLKNVGSSGGDLMFGFSEKMLSRLVEGTGRALMASSRPSETSLIMVGARNSAFTTALIDGLKGEADRHGEGLIRIFDLFDYVSRQVPQITGDAQHPIFKASQLEQNFPVALSRGGVKSLSSLSINDGGNINLWQELADLLPALYPMGPGDQEIWMRAGGDISRLRLQGTGRGTWFAALKVLEQGGGGTNISINALVNASLKDFPNHPRLTNIDLCLKKQNPLAE